jgi:hypothetical protein
MRHPGDSSAGRSASRPRDPASGQTSGRRGRSAGGPPPAGRQAGGRAADGSSGSGPDGDQSVFVPGYRSQRPGGPGGHQAGPAAPGSDWPGPAMSDAAGRGPVRGFPPAPGQPPPLYPPGQFAAWNRADGGVAVADQDSAWPATPGADWGQDRPWPDDDAAAVSDPAADATATGTWRTYADGVDDGAWGDQRGGAGPQTAPAPGGGATSEFPATGSSAAAPASATADAGRPPGGASGSNRNAPSSGRKGSAPKSTAPPRGSTAKRSTGKRKGRSSVALAVTAVVVVAIAAAGFLLYTASHQNTPTAGPTTGVKASKHPTPSASPTPTPTNHILTRSADPLPLTVAQLFPARFVAMGHPFLRTASKSQRKCPSAIVGGRLQSAVKAAKCSQVVRASYVSFGLKVMGTIGVLNLSTSQTAEKAGGAVNGSNFVALLKGRRGVTRGLGRGTGIVEADVKGHYLILMWAQFTTHHRPRKPSQKTRLENFMKNLFEQTANVSLTRRMVDGTP